MFPHCTRRFAGLATKSGLKSITPKSIIPKPNTTKHTTVNLKNAAKLIQQANAVMDSIDSKPVDQLPVIHIKSMDDPHVSDIISFYVSEIEKVSETVNKNDQRAVRIGFIAGFVTGLLTFNCM